MNKESLKEDKSSIDDAFYVIEKFYTENSMTYANLPSTIDSKSQYEIMQKCFEEKKMLLKLKQSLFVFSQRLKHQIKEIEEIEKIDLG